MAEIKFKAMRHLSHTGSKYRAIAKSGDLQFDCDSNSDDGVWLRLNTGNRVMIDCNGKTGEFKLMFESEDFEVQND